MFDKETWEKLDKAMDELAKQHDKIADWAKEEGLTADSSIEDLTADQAKKLLELSGGTIEELIAFLVEEREKDDAIDRDGRYNDPELRNTDIILSKIGYVFDPQKGAYVKTELPITLPELSDLGKKIFAREKEETDLRCAKDLSNSNIIARIFNYQDPLLPYDLTTIYHASTDETVEALLRNLSDAKEIRLIGFNHEFDTLPEVQEAYKKAAERGAKIKMIYHPEYTSFGFSRYKDHHIYEECIEMRVNLPGAEACILQPTTDKFFVESQDNSPNEGVKVLGMGVGFSNTLYYAVTAIDSKLLIVSHHFRGVQGKGREKNIMENPGGIPGIKQGFHDVFDKFFDKDGDVPYTLTPRGGNVIMRLGDGHTHIVDYS